MPYLDILSRQDDLGRSHYSHEILVKGPDFEHCSQRALRFFERYQLVRYSRVVVDKGGSLSSAGKDFEERLSMALSKNREIVNALVTELEGEGVGTLRDISELPQGYKTKMLHVITHLLDGFFGIDTYFYNLEEDSHWVSDAGYRKIRQERSQFWLLRVEADI